MRPVGNAQGEEESSLTATLPKEEEEEDRYSGVSPSNNNWLFLAHLGSLHGLKHGHWFSAPSLGGWFCLWKGNG